MPDEGVRDTPPEPITLTTCLNCGATNVEAFCPHCGQERGTPIGPVKEIVLDAAGQFLQWDGRLMQTLKGLLRPGFLTVEYLQGRRMPYISPFRMYLWASALHLLVFSMTTQKEVQATLEAQMRLSEHRQPLEPGRQPGANQARTGGQARPPSPRRTQIEKRVETRAVPLVKGMLDNFGIVNMALLPFYGGFLHLLYRRQRRHYAEQLITILHNETAVLLLSTPTLLLPNTQMWKSLLAMGIYPLYYYFSLRRVYGGFPRQTVAKTLVKLFLYFAAVAFLVIVASVTAGMLVVLLP